MRTRILTGIVALAFLSGCEKERWDDCFTATGDVVMDERTVAPFTGIDISDNVDLEIIPDTVDRLILEAGRGLLEQIETKVVEGNTLHIRNNNTCNWVRRYDVPIIVHLHCRSLELITYRGTGDITTAGTITGSTFTLQQWGGSGTSTLDVEVDYCQVKLHTGTGDAILSGSAATLELYSGSMGRLEARSMQVHDCYLANAGSNDMYIRADGALGAVLTRSGSVYYAGDPVIAWSEVSGTGQLIKLD